MENDMIRNFYSELDNLYTQGKQAEIEDFLIEKIKSNPHSCCHCDPLVVAMYSELGSFYRGQGRLGEAIQWFEATLHLIIIHMGKNNMEYATALNNLAGALRMDGQHDKATSSFEEALCVYKTLVGEDNYYYISCINNLSLLEINRQNYDRAEELLKSVLPVLEEKQELLQEKAITLCNLGTCELRRKNNNRAEQYLHRAKEIYRRFPKGQQVHLAAVCNSLGGIHYHRGNMAEAAKAYAEAKELTQFYFGHSVEYAIACESLARCLEGQEAVVQLQEGMTALEKLGRKETSQYRRMKEKLDLLEAGR